MRQFGALSIRSKLIGVLSLFIAGMVGLGLFDHHSIRTIHGLMGEVQQNWMPGVRWATALKTGVGDARVRRELAALMASLFMPSLKWDLIQRLREAWRGMFPQWRNSTLW